MGGAIIRAPNAKRPGVEPERLKAALVASGGYFNRIPTRS